MAARLTVGVLAPVAVVQGVYVCVCMYDVYARMYVCMFVCVYVCMHASEECVSVCSALRCM
jgi:hypothetical protein